MVDNQRNRGVRSIAVRTLQFTWTIGCIVCFGMAANQFMTGQTVRQKIIESGRSLDSVPPTMLTQHNATGVALIFVGMICLLFAIRSGWLSRDQTIER